METTPSSDSPFQYHPEKFGSPEEPVRHLHVHPQVAKLFRLLLQYPEGSQLFCNGYEPFQEGMEYLIGTTNAKVTAIAKTPEQSLRLEALYSDKVVSITETEHFERFAPKDQYHLAFSVYPFPCILPTKDKPIADRNQVQFPKVNDDLQLWKVSEGNAYREAPMHLVGLEAMMRSVIYGGYFGCVLPRRWVGREMRYLTWWTDRAALVARIVLPKEAVTLRWLGKSLVHPGSTEATRSVIEVPAPSGVQGFQDETAAKPGWELFIWQRPCPPVIEEEERRENPTSCNQRVRLQHAEFRYSPFVFNLTNTTEIDSSGNLEVMPNEALNQCMRTFHHSDWWLNSIKLHNKMLNENKNHHWCSLNKYKPHGLTELKNAWFFKPTQEHQMEIRVVENMEAMKKIPMAVQVKIGSKIKLSPGPAESWTPQKPTVRINTQFALLDLRHRDGLFQNEDGDWEFHYNHQLKERTFHEMRDTLVSDMYRAGLVPCMTQNEYQKMKKKERWLSIQLTPVERMVPVSGEDETKEDSWETLYEDIGMDSVHPEIMELWRKRAYKMKLDQITFGFQFEDVIRMAAKQSLLNSIVMGLGKTRETLIAMLLRCSKKNLIVVPKKLVGEWQDEIQNTIVPYMRRVKRNWQGHIMDPSMQEIEQAHDCLPSQLRTFNLISYDKLKSTPRDGKFFKCPECGTITYSPFPERHRDETTGIVTELAPTCPGDPLKLDDEYQKMSTCSHRILKWREDNKLHGRSKHKVLVGEDGLPVLNEDGKVTKLHWKRGWGNHSVNFPVERVVERDTRPPKPILPRMEELENVYKKMEPLVVGYDENPNTGIKVPIVKQVERDFHVKWTFSELLRGKFSIIAADEALYFVNTEAKRSQAILHLTARTRWPLTGTPMKGNPDSILPLINWTVRREAFPGYREYSKGWKKRWLDKYKTEVKVDGVIAEDGSMVGGRKKLIPKISNPELFQAELAPFMLRHVRNEPPVLKDISHKKIVIADEKIEMDEKHRVYYQKWLQSFAEWWEQMKREEEGKSVKGQLMVKMNYLFNASTIPHNMLDEIMQGKDDVVKGWAQKIGKYKGPLTAKMKRCFQLVRQHVDVGDKTLVFSARTKNSDNGNTWAAAAKLNSMVVDGRTPLKARAGEVRGRRHNLVQQFRNEEYHVMWAGLDALAEGMNIPEANRGIILDPSWVPKQPRQAIGRMIRPQQQKVIFSTFLMHKGTIEDYMAAVCYLKGRSQDEGIDFMEFSDFSVAMVPDIKQYADWIVDGTEEIEKAKMWTAIEHLRKQDREEGEEGL